MFLLKWLRCVKLPLRQSHRINFQISQAFALMVKGSVTWLRKAGHRHILCLYFMRANLILIILIPGRCHVTNRQHQTGNIYGLKHGHGHGSEPGKYEN